MANSVVQAALMLIGVLSSCFGMYSVYKMTSNILELIYSGLWFILGFLSNLTGLIAIVISFYENDEGMAASHHVLQRHYMLSWLTAIIGYPTLVALFWHTYAPTVLAYFLVALSALPLLAWALKKGTWIVWATQGVIGLAIIGHIYICYLAWNVWGIVGAVIMIQIIISLSVPTRGDILGMTSREACMIGIAADSYIFYLAISEMVAHPQHLKSYVPF